MENPILLSEEKRVYRDGAVVRRPEHAWSPSVRRFLKHLESDRLPVEHIIAVENGEELSAFIEGGLVHPHKWTDEALYEVGRLVAALHQSAAAFTPGPDDLWQPWCLRELGGDARICCHGDIAPWNVITDHGMPKALIDWEYAGPLDPLVELARICWLFPQLVDDDLQALYDLPSAEKRAGQVRLICDGYGLPAAQRRRLTRQILEVIICETAHEAIDPGLTFDNHGPLWGFAWRTRSLYWVWRHQAVLDRALQ